MNKKLLAFAAVAAMTLSANAAEVSLLNDNSFTANDLDISYSTITAVDGVFTLNITADPAEKYSNQFFIKADKALAAGQKYYFSLEAKTTSPRTIEFQAHGDPGAYKYWNIAGGSFEVGADWKKHEFTGEVPADADGMQTIAISLSTAPEACTMNFKNIVWNLIEEGGDTPEQPEDPKPAGEVVASTDFTSMSAYTMWKSEAADVKIENGSLVVTNATASSDFWNVQYMVADGFSLVADATYTITAKIKGFAGKLHYNLGTWSDNVMGDIDVEEAADWQVVSAKATAKADAAGDAHLLFQTGDFVGAFQIASVELTKDNPAGIDAVEVEAPATHWTVYNLMGVKVLDTDNEAALNELANGIYVINGKKVAIRK